MIIVDTNFLIYLVKYRVVSVLEEHIKEIAVPSAVKKELKALSEKAEKARDREAAKLALLILDKWKIKEIHSEGNADDAIIELAVKNRAKVATMDKMLGKRLENKGIKVIRLRQKKKLLM